MSVGMRMVGMGMHARMRGALGRVPGKGAVEERRESLTHCCQAVMAARAALVSFM